AADAFGQAQEDLEGEFDFVAIGILAGGHVDQIAKRRIFFVDEVQAIALLVHALFVVGETAAADQDDGNKDDSVKHDAAHECSPREPTPIPIPLIYPVRRVAATFRS